MKEYLLPLLMFTLLINIPLGYLRRRSKKFSLKWALYTHLSIPLVVALRLWAGITIRAIPLFILSAVIGQFVGGLFSGK